ncbi:hypothetical protein [Actinoallomurus sp. CA-150999]|uniref:hypothetical protein n=1 Tax=Actinoallomurus sp. CA-150999 TaxID=3239887 RepID=UPI003D92CE28
METESRAEKSRHPFPIRWLAGIGVLVLAALSVVAFFRVQVCDQQLTSAGRTVRVCRHLQSTDPPVIAVGLVALLALGTFFTEISGFGFTLKREAEAAKEAAQDARREAAAAKETSDDVAEGLGHVLAGDVADPQPEGAQTVGERIDRLAKEYNRIRWTMPSGGARTAQLTSVLKSMIETLRGVEDFDVDWYLTNKDRGLRLAAFAYLRANPDSSRVPALIDALVVEDKPFGQYSALRALEGIVEIDPGALDSAGRKRLRRLLTELPPETDRVMVLERVLRKAGADRTGI